ncbi:aspartate kinase [Sulfurihydrogenibium yellowstonense]|uniref:Aspartokinase n=1 Tax=Sulfurihydrogenibium yellowstonense SS-5 TaxID=432331 RepID=C4FIV0_9AQUI|nr:aspartate kinase [Sulfurihydrogenibium yellowstonense]EEP60998.1 asparate kinase, monofunctional class [Sulfurihydrogenibium yellowstonense SS-5]
MPLIVQKYGGTSVGNIERIKNVAKKIKKAVDAGNKVVVISSAMSGETDRLLGLTRELSSRPDPREQDMVVSTGEQVAIGLVAIALKELGIDAVSLTGWQVPIITDDVHTKARIKKIDTHRIRKHLDEGKVVIVAGFQGVTEGGDITTLGRGGSDTSAVALAAALKADVCEIYTDVPGVFTADPRIVENARKIPVISYEEMMEMASLGSKVMQIRSVEFGAKYGVKIHVRSSFNDEEGTWIVEENEEMEKMIVRGISHELKESRITVVRVPDKPGVAAKLFKALGDRNIVVDMIVQNVSHKGFTDISFTVNKTDADVAEEIAKEVAQEIGAEEVERNDKIAKVSIVGLGMKTHAGTAAKMFEVLSKEGINIYAISTSEIKISVLIDEKYAELAVRSLHEAFIENMEGDIQYE